MSKYPALTPGINSQTGSAEFRNQMLQAFRGVDNRLLVTPGVINTFVAGSTNSGAAETTLLSIPITSDTLSKIGSSVLTFGGFLFAANGNLKTIKLKLNTPSTTSTWFTISSTYNNISGNLQFEIVRSGAAAEIVWGQFLPSAGVATVTGIGTLTTDLSAGATMLITGQGTSNADISLLYAKTQLLTT